MNDLLSSTNSIYENITKRLIEKHYSISTMESCTAGLVSTLLTDVPGSSEIMKGAFITYCNEAKIKYGVPENIINQFGVYSSETATAMALACKRTYNSYFGIGITGIIDRLDPNNKSNGKNVYFTIVWGTTHEENIHTFSITIPDSITNRFERKMYVANNIGIHLSDILSE